jgi:hypothetical protein
LQLNPVLERALTRLGDFGPALKVSLRAPEYFETTQIAAIPPKRRWKTTTPIKTDGD